MKNQGALLRKRISKIKEENLSHGTDFQGTQSEAHLDSPVCGVRDELDARICEVKRVRSMSKSRLHCPLDKDLPFSFGRISKADQA